MATVSVSGSGAITVGLDDNHVAVGPVSLDTGPIKLVIDPVTFLTGTVGGSSPLPATPTSADVLGTVNSVVGSASSALAGVLNSVAGGAAGALQAIQGGLSSLAGAGSGTFVAPAAPSIGAVSLVEDASKTVLVSFKNPHAH